MTYASLSTTGFVDLDLLIARGRLSALEVKLAKRQASKAIKSYLTMLFTLAVSSSELAADSALPATGRWRERERSFALGQKGQDDQKDVEAKNKQNIPFDTFHIII
jgi:hypothetical protein